MLDASAIQKYYENVHVSNTTYFGNTLAVANFKSHREWSKLGKPTNRDEWLMTAVTVNVGVCDYIELLELTGDPGILQSALE